MKRLLSGKSAPGQRAILHEDHDPSFHESHIFIPPSKDDRWSHHLPPFPPPSAAFLARYISRLELDLANGVLKEWHGVSYSSIIGEPPPPFESKREPEINHLLLHLKSIFPQISSKELHITFFLPEPHQVFIFGAYTFWEEGGLLSVSSVMSSALF